MKVVAPGEIFSVEIRLRAYNIFINPHRIYGYADPYLIHTNINPRSRRTCSPKTGDLAHQNSMPSGDSENRGVAGCVLSR